MASTTEQVSKVVLRDTTVPDGTHKVYAWEYPDMTVTEFGDVAFVDGEGELSFQVSPNRRVLAAAVDRDVFPPIYGAVISAMTEGQTVLYANEVLRIPGNLLPNCVFFGDMLPKNDTGVYTLPDGSFASSLTNRGEFQYSPKGVYDHLQTGESATVEIPYYLDAMNYSDIATSLVFGGSWTDNGDDTYTKTTTGNTQPLSLRWSMSAGDLIRIHATVSGNGPGAVYVSYQIFDEGLGYAVEYAEIQAYAAGFNGEIELNSTVPVDGLLGVMIHGSSSFNGTISNPRIDEPDTINAERLTLTILPSPDVSDFIIQPDALSGTSWVASGSGIAATYTKTAGDTNPLSVPVSMGAGKIMECAYSIASLTAGSITVELVGDTTETHQYTLDSADRDVLYFTVPTNVTQLRFVPTIDFDGVIEKVYVRELLCTDAVPTPRKIETESAATGELMVSPIMPLPSSVPTEFDNSFTGVLNNNAEFGVRITSTTTYIVQDATATAKRSAISTKGGDYCVIDNVSVVGGYPVGSPSYAYQQAFITSDDTPPMYKTWVWNTETDGLLLPQDGSYAVNGDHLVLNTTLDREGHKPVAYAFNDSGANWPDAIVDCKIRGFFQHCDYSAGYRTFRTHHITSALIANANFSSITDTQGSIHLRRGTSRTQLFECKFDGVRALSTDQLFSDGAIAMDTTYNSGADNLNAVYVMKTFPRIPSEARMHFTSLELQIQYGQTGDWTDISENYGLMFIGSLRRTLTGLTSGTHNLRLRAINGEHVGSWYTETGVTVL